MKLVVITQLPYQDIVDQLYTALTLEHLKPIFTTISEEPFDTIRGIVDNVRSLRPDRELDGYRLLERYPTPMEGRVDLIMLNEYLVNGIPVCEGGPRLIYPITGLGEKGKCIVSTAYDKNENIETIAHELTHSLGIEDHCDERECLLNEDTRRVKLDLCDDHKQEFYRLYPNALKLRNFKNC